MLSYAVFDHKTLATNIAEVTSLGLLDPDRVGRKNVSVLEIAFCVRVIGDEFRLITCTAMRW